MNDSWAGVIEAHWPWLIPIIVLGFIALSTTKALPAAKAIFWSPIARWVRRLPHREREMVDAQIKDLQRVTSYQGEQIAELRYRDEMNWAWVLIDQEWHRVFEFTAASNGWQIPPHVSYMEHRTKWMQTHPVPENYKDLI